MIFKFIFVTLFATLVLGQSTYDNINIHNDSESMNIEILSEKNVEDAFNGVYTECFVFLSYTCLQRKTLLYLSELNKLSEISIIGDYVKFVKLNNSNETSNQEQPISSSDNSEELSKEIDEAVESFFERHIIRFGALGKDISTKTDEFVGRKRRKGGGGNSGEDWGKKKMMMMGMMCMKMKLMMMIPAMMGMMGIMSFKGMMFSMMSFLMAKTMLLMKLIEKRNGAGGGGDGGWQAGGGGGGGAWMPAGGQDGGGGYDANGQWQSRSNAEFIPENIYYLQTDNKPIITSVIPTIRYNNKMNTKKPMSLIKTLKNEVTKIENADSKGKSRKKRGIFEDFQSAYMYWTNRIISTLISNKAKKQNPRYKLINGIKYVYYPMKMQKPNPQKLPLIKIKDHLKEEDFKPLVTEEDFNKGEIVEGGIESRMNKKKFHKIKQTVDETLEDNPWQ